MSPLVISLGAHQSQSPRLGDLSSVFASITHYLLGLGGLSPFIEKKTSHP